MKADNPDYNTDVPSDLPIPERTWKQRLAAVCIILAILAAGGAGAVVLIKTKPTAKKKSPPKMQVLVETRSVAPTNTRVTVEALGRMIPSRRIALQARVAGTVQYLHPNFIQGGILRQGEVVVRLDDTDYQLELQRKKNLLRQAQADLRLEEGNQAVARQEWELIKRQGDEIDTSSVDLALRQPQLEKVQAAIASARTDVERVEVDLARTVIQAPFNAVVTEKNIDLGSQVSSQSQLASLVGIDSFWAEVTLPAEKLAWISLPEKDKPGSPARVLFNSDAPRQGRIIKLLPEVEQEGLMARLLIEVEDPMAVSTDKSPLLLGSFVRAEIEGKKLENVFQLPRSALKNDREVLLVKPDRTLHIQPVSVLWKDSDLVYVDVGLEEGDQIIVSQVAAPVEGMPLILNGIDTGADQPQQAATGGEHGQQ